MHRAAAAAVLCASRRLSRSNRYTHKFKAYINAHEGPKSFASRAKQHSDLFPLNSQMVSRRQFASKSKHGDEGDQGVYDDFESRLLKPDYGGGDSYMDDSINSAGGVKFDDYDEWKEDDSVAEVAADESIEESSEVAADDDSDSEAGNEQSDEEFEGERTDEELDELLANTPLFEPPDIPEYISPNEPLPEFSFRPEGPVFYPGMEYDPEELDVTRPFKPRKREVRSKPEISVNEVINKADFRNVRYLTRFIEESGNIRPRREFTMRKKSHNRIVRAIKTARFFGLMPYSNMGRPRYMFNEPFDEYAEFYESDEEEKVMKAAQRGATDRSIFGNRDLNRNLNRNYSNQRPGGASNFNRWRR